jgi:hypothetical protein
MRHMLMVTVAALLMAFYAQSASAQLLALTNDDVTRLVAMRVSDQTVIAVIDEAQAKRFDLSSRAVSELTVSGVSTAVVAAMGHASTPRLQPDHGPAAAEQAAAGRPQSLAAAAELPALTLGEAGDLDRSKFDTVYATSKSMEGAALTQQFPEAKNAFDAAVAVARNRATTRAEQSLVKQYLLVSSKCEAWVLQQRTQRLLGRTYRNDLENQSETWTQALALLTAANAIYLGK